MFFVPKFKIFNSSLSSLLTVAIIFGKLSCSCSATSIISSIGLNPLDFKGTPKFVKENCKCSTQWQCECCAKANNELLNVHQKLCADWTIFSNSWNIQANVRLNENVLYTNTFSVWNIPPFCAAILPAIALTGCIQMHSIAQNEFNTLHGCANITINVATFNLVNFQIGCMDLGTGGIQFDQPNHDFVSTNSTEKLSEMGLETNDFVKLTTPARSNEGPNEDITMSSTTIRQDFLSYLKNKIY